eukprot:7197071-Pyramimonas_sp.AAC.1
MVQQRAGELVNVLREANAEVPEDLLKFGCHVKKKESKLYAPPMTNRSIRTQEAVARTYGYGYKSSEYLTPDTSLTSVITKGDESCYAQ